MALTAWDPHATVEEALAGLMYGHLLARKYSNIITVNSVQDIRLAQRDKKLALLLVSQDGDFIQDKLHRLEAFYRLGLRMIIPTYNATNNICGGCLDRVDIGLTRFGQLVIDECNRLGLLLDCSHLGKRSSLEIIERSTQPIVFSHSNAQAVAENPRSVDDEQIKACVAKGGVVGIVAVGSLAFKKGSQRRPNLQDLVDNVDYLADLIGTTDNIGIGTDFSLGTYPVHQADPWGEPIWQATLSSVRGAYNSLPGMTTRPSSPMRYVDGFNTYAEILDMIAELNRRGYKDEDVRKILGENFMRVFQQTWK
jgi:membrane dipeptidase